MSRLIYLNVLQLLYIEITSKHSGCKCPSTGLLRLVKTRCEQLDGPGPIRVLLGTYNVRFSDNGGGTSITSNFNIFSNLCG